MQWLSDKRTYRLGFLIITPLVIGLLLFWVRGVLPPFILAAFLAYLIYPIVKRVERRGIPRLLAIILTYAFLLTFLCIIGVLAYPKIMTQLSSLLEAIPTYRVRIQRVIRGFYDFSHYALPPGLQQVLEQRIAASERVLMKLVTDVLDAMLALVAELPTLLLAPFLAFYLLKDADLLKKGIELAIPQKFRIDVMGLLRDIDEVLRNFLRGHLLICLAVGLLSGVGYSLIGLPFAMVLGVVAGITEIIPFFGPIIGLVPALAIASLQSGKLVLWTLLVSLLIQQLEVNVISPKILGDSLGLHPITIVFALLAGGQLYGIIGMLIAVPIAAIIKVIIRFIFLKLVASG